MMKTERGHANNKHYYSIKNLLDLQALEVITKTVRLGKQTNLTINQTATV